MYDYILETIQTFILTCAILLCCIFRNVIDLSGYIVVTHVATATTKVVIIILLVSEGNFLVRDTHAHITVHRVVTVIPAA